MTNALFIEYPVYRSHSTHNVTLARIQNLNGFSIGFVCSHSAHNVTLARSYTKLEWLFYRICLFTLRAQRDARTYTSTTDQCGARSGSPQLIICSQCNSSMKIQVHVATNVSRINCKCCIYHKLDRQYSPCNLRASSKL